MGDWISNHWNAIWGLAIYFYRIFHDLCFGGNNREQKFQKLKNIGPDLYWISVVLWGVVLLNLDSQYLSSYLGKTSHLRILILILLAFVIGPLIVKLKKIGDDFTGGAIRSWTQVVGSGLFYLGIHVIGLGSLLLAFYLIGK